MIPIFKTYIMGGFEGSTFLRPSGERYDAVDVTRHADRFDVDLRLLNNLGIQTIRDCMRWPSIDLGGGRYDFSGWMRQLEIAAKTKTQVIWDLCHFGYPDHLHPFKKGFIEAFTEYAYEAAMVRRSIDGKEPGLWCPINEISYWSFAADHSIIHPIEPGNGHRLKETLVEASKQAIRAIRQIDSGARFIQAEPVIHRVGHDEATNQEAENWNSAQYQTWDILASEQELLVDVVGVNFYPWNQAYTTGQRIGMGEEPYRPLYEILLEIHGRYKRPILITETGADGKNGPGWLRYVLGEAETAKAAGVSIQGICVYPVMDYPGWDNSDHKQCGFIGLDEAYLRRSLRDPMVKQLYDYHRWSKMYA